jgi:hypothetical protein
MQGVDTDIDTSEVLWVWCATWQMIDNIVVRDDVIQILQPWVLLIIGVVVAVVVIVIAIVFFRRRRTE